MDKSKKVQNTRKRDTHIYFKSIYKIRVVSKSDALYKKTGKTITHLQGTYKMRSHTIAIASQSIPEKRCDLV